MAPQALGPQPFLDSGGLVDRPIRFPGPARPAQRRGPSSGGPRDRRRVREHFLSHECCVRAVERLAPFFVRLPSDRRSRQPCVRLVAPGGRLEPEGDRRVLHRADDGGCPRLVDVVWPGRCQSLAFLGVGRRQPFEEVPEYGVVQRFRVGPCRRCVGDFADRRQLVLLHPCPLRFRASLVRGLRALACPAPRCGLPRALRWCRFDRELSSAGRRSSCSCRSSRKSALTAAAPRRAAGVSLMPEVTGCFHRFRPARAGRCTTRLSPITSCHRSSPLVRGNVVFHAIGV